MDKSEILKAADLCFDIIYEAWVKTKDESYDTALTVLANIELLTI